MPMQFDNPYKIKKLGFGGAVDLVNPVNIPNSVEEVLIQKPPALDRRRPMDNPLNISGTAAIGTLFRQAL